MPDAPQVEFRGIAETLERCKVLGISATRYLFTHSEVTSLIAAVRADERAALASQADAGDREVVEAALADLARVLVPATKAGLGAVESRKAKAIEVILSRLASLRAALATAEVRLTSAEGMAELWRNKYNEIRAVMIEVADENVALKAHRDALARRVGEALAIIGESGCYCDHDDPCDMTCITGRIEAALAAERERALRWAVIEVRGALANQHREGYGPYLPAIEQFVQDGLRALTTPAPGAAGTPTEGT